MSFVCECLCLERRCVQIGVSLWKPQVSLGCHSSEAIVVISCCQLDRTCNHLEARPPGTRLKDYLDWLSSENVYEGLPLTH